MNGWMDRKQASIMNAKARYACSLSKDNKKSIIALRCMGEVGSHVEAVNGFGWKFVRESDEYNPFGGGCYAVFTSRSENLVAQLAVHFEDDDMYVTGYVPEKDGWYEWERYTLEGTKSDCEAGKIKTKLNDFETSTQERERKITIGGDPESSAELYAAKRKKQEEVRDTAGGSNRGSGMEIYAESATSNVFDRYISIQGIRSLNEIADKLIAVKTTLPFSPGGGEDVFKLNVINVGSAAIKFHRRLNPLFSDRREIYFVSYNGSEFIYYGSLVQ